MNIKTSLVLTSALVLLVPCHRGVSQEPEGDTVYFEVPWTELTVTKAEGKTLGDIEDRHYSILAEHSERLFELEGMCRDSREESVVLRVVRDVEVEDALSEEARKTLNEQRRAEARKIAKSNSVDHKKFIEFHRQFDTFATHITAADEITVYQGLPRGVPEFIERIKKQFETRRISGFGYFKENGDVDREEFDFYREPLTGGTLPEKMRALVISYDWFEPYGGPSFCGSFHPDICLEWKRGEKIEHAMICLGCGEMSVELDGLNALFDLTPESLLEFRTLVKHRFIYRDLSELRPTR